MKKKMHLASSAKNGVDIQKHERGKTDELLSSSVQEKFRGFSYTGSYEDSSSIMEQGVHAIDWGREPRDV